MRTGQGHSHTVGVAELLREGAVGGGAWDLAAEHAAQVGQVRLGAVLQAGLIPEEELGGCHHHQRREALRVQTVLVDELRRLVAAHPSQTQLILVQLRRRQLQQCAELRRIVVAHHQAALAAGAQQMLPAGAGELGHPGEALGAYPRTKLALRPALRRSVAFGPSRVATAKHHHCGQIRSSQTVGRPLRLALHHHKVGFVTPQTTTVDEGTSVFTGRSSFCVWRLRKDKERTLIGVSRDDWNTICRCNRNILRAESHQCVQFTQRVGRTSEREVHGLTGANELDGGIGLDIELLTETSCLATVYDT
mmetsp:Transcript_28382/g.71272  ORF Transcript_28382/g.71272 Transcript_28382/m.71272 type:complete len:306 (+) Transcript_28382:269-1186(+)